MMPDLDEYLTTHEIAERYRVSPRTVEYWRQVDTGPPWIRIGRRALYPVKDVERYDAEPRGRARAALRRRAAS